MNGQCYVNQERKEYTPNLSPTRSKGAHGETKDKQGADDFKDPCKIPPRNTYTCIFKVQTDR